MKKISLSGALKASPQCHIQHHHHAETYRKKHRANVGVLSLRHFRDQFLHHHISSKNSDYTAIEAYLVYQHDAFTGKQLLDEQGRPKLRESYLLDTLECGDFSFATACLLANRKYGKNTQHGDIKSHQYIISFDPRDAADNGLTIHEASTSQTTSLPASSRKSFPAK